MNIVAIAKAFKAKNERGKNKSYKITDKEMHYLLKAIKAKEITQIQAIRAMCEGNNATTSFYSAAYKYLMNNSTFSHDMHTLFHRALLPQGRENTKEDKRIQKHDARTGARSLFTS
jgi:hypothetical protein